MEAFLSRVPPDQEPGRATERPERAGILRPWGAAIVAARGFPARVTQIPARWGRP